jgi:hypothetical protein
MSGSAAIEISPGVADQSLSLKVSLMQLRCAAYLSITLEAYHHSQKHFMRQLLVDAYC